MNLLFNIENQHITQAHTKHVVSDSVEYLTSSFTFSEDWDGFIKTAVFKGESGTYSVLLENDRCTVPHEVISGRFGVSVFGTNGGTRITTDCAYITVQRSGYAEGETPQSPTPSVYEQLLDGTSRLQTAVETETAARIAADDELQNKINTKADKQTMTGGFVGGSGANAADGGAVGYGANTFIGFAGGSGAYASKGGAAGYNANTENGGAVGTNAWTWNGGAVGAGAKTTNGFAGGENAICENNGRYIDAIQLGTGTNIEEKTFQVYTYRMMNADGTIPYERYGAAVDTKIAAAKSQHTADIESLSKSIDTKIAEAKSIIPKRYIVSELPTTDIDENGTYLVPVSVSDSGVIISPFAEIDDPTAGAPAPTVNLYTEYAYINGKWEIIGNPEKVDLSDYYTKTEVNGKLSTINSELSGLEETSNDHSNAITQLENNSEIKPTITTSAETDLTVTLAHNTETRCGEVTSLTLTLPSTTADDYISSIVFTSGATPTNLVYPDTIKMIGEGCIDGVFTPAANKRYEVIVSYDGANVVGVVGGYAI